MKCRLLTCVLMCVIAGVGSYQSSAQVSVSTAVVGDTGNQADDTGYGAVGYQYEIGVYEVTAGQYTTFLNAVAASDTYGLYNPGMVSDPQGCGIQQSGTDGSFTYSIALDREDFPVNFVSFWDACRFANWLHNGQPSGVQDATTTEDGAYPLNGYTGGDGREIAASPVALWKLPSADEWYKAAFYKSGSTNAGYWEYPTQSDAAPANVLVDPDPGNTANYRLGGVYTVSDPWRLTDVGEFENSASAYGTFDQAGNVFEWLETVNADNGRRFNWGCSWGQTNATLMAASTIDLENDPDLEVDSRGFRLVKVIHDPAVTCTIDTVTVADAGNDADVTGLGSVGYVYQAGTFEVSASQYTAFLNAVAASDTYGLYNEQMWLDPQGCKIQRAGQDGSYVYGITDDRTDRPVNFVSYWDCVRFVNWLHNGQPSGAQDTTTTEDGAYPLNGYTGMLGVDIVRNPAAQWVIPTQDEWYKAAYYVSGSTTAGYWDYATSSDVAPGNVVVDPDTGNNACYRKDGVHCIGSPYWQTAAGEFENSASAYGTSDQNGNVWEWMDTLGFVNDTRARRLLAGGAWDTTVGSQLAAGFTVENDPDLEMNNRGFRVAKLVPDPAVTCTIDTVTVGDAGNDSEPVGEGSGGFGPDASIGGVGYEYTIGTYEITAGQYAAFLNAVATSDTYGLYNEQMWSDPQGCRIQRSGEDGAYFYAVAVDRADRPVNFVSFWDACRFANWLHNGQPGGVQDATTTEDGAYTLNGYNDADGRTIVRNSGAMWRLASEDEWHKSAYYKSGSATAGYWDYATAGDVAPANVVVDPDPGNSACYRKDGVHCIGSPYWQTPVGEFENSASAYGTFDQNGNVWEWLDTVVVDERRGTRGGSWMTINSTDLAASYRNYSPPLTESDQIGIRVSGFSSPADCAQVWQLGYGLPADINQDCVVDLLDYAYFADQWSLCTDPTLPECVPAPGQPSSSVILPGRTWDADTDASGEEVRTDYVWNLQKGDVTIAYQLDLTGATLTTYAGNDAPAYAPVRFGPLTGEGDAVDESYAIWVNNALLWGDASNRGITLSNGYVDGPQQDEYSFVGAFPGVYDGTDPLASGAGSYTLTDASYKGIPGVHDIVVQLRYGAGSYSGQAVHSAYMTIDGVNQVETGSASPVGFDFIGDADTMYIALGWSDWDFDAATGGGTITISDITVTQDQSGFTCGDWGYLSADTNTDCQVDNTDLSVMAADWLTCNVPGQAGCVATW